MFSLTPAFRRCHRTNLKSFVLSELHMMKKGKVSGIAPCTNMQHANPFKKYFSTLSLEELEKIANQVKERQEREMPRTKEELERKIEEIIVEARLNDRRKGIELSPELVQTAETLSKSYLDPDAGLVKHEDLTVPKNLTEAYAVQGKVAQNILKGRKDAQVVGYKLGATDPRTAMAMRLQSPFYGPLFAHRVLRPEVVKGRAVDLRKLREHENVKGICPHFVFLVEREFIEGESYHELQVLDSIGRVYPAVEIVSTRFEADHVPPSLLIADMAANGALVLGTPIKSISQIDLMNHPVKVTLNTKDEEKTITGNGSFVMKDPTNALSWFVNKLTFERNVPIPRGACIAGGSLTGPVIRVEKDTKVKVDFGEMGVLEVQM